MRQVRQSASAFDANARVQDDVRRKRGQFRCVFAKVVDIASAPAILDPHVAAFGPAQLLQPLPESRGVRPAVRIVCGAAAREHADPSYPFRLRRAPRAATRDRGLERLQRRAASRDRWDQTAEPQHDARNLADPLARARSGDAAAALQAPRRTRVVASAFSQAEDRANWPQRDELDQEMTTAEMGD